MVHQYLVSGTLVFSKAQSTVYNTRFVSYPRIVPLTKNVVYLPLSGLEVME